MRKFTDKNRQKRKYTRKSTPQEVYGVSKIWSVSLLPVIIVVVAFLTTMLINLNLRETTVSSVPQIAIPEVSVTFSLDEVAKPFQSLPNLFNQPVAFLTSFAVLAYDSLSYGVVVLGNVLVLALTFLDPRPGLINGGNAFTTLFTATGTMGSAFISGMLNIGELLIQSTASALTMSASFVQTVSATTFDYVGRGVETIATSFGYIIEKVAWILSLIFDAITGVIEFIYEKITTFINGVIRVILIPFTILGAFWEQIKPPVMQLGYYIQMAGVDLTRSFESFGKLASVLLK